MQWTIPSNFFLPLVSSGVFVGAACATLFGAVPMFGVGVLLASTFFIFFFIRRSKIFLFAVLVCVAGCLSAVSTVLFDRSISHDMNAWEGRPVSLEGVVIQSPDRRETSTRMVLDVTTVDGNSASGRVLVTVNPYERVSYGESVRVSGVLKTPESFETDSGTVFNYPTFLYAHRITHVMSFADVTVLGAGYGNVFSHHLLSMKEALVKQIEHILPDPEAPLLSGLLLGERQSLGDSLYQSLQRAGVVHMVVLSGYNVSLVANAIITSTSYVLPRAFALGSAFLGIVVFALMTGASETTVRASIMACVLLVASVLRRPGSGVRALLLAGIGMVWWNPYLVLFDLSFQLSFVATAGILWWADGVSARLTFLPTFLGLRSIGGATLAAQAAVLPLLLLSLGTVSLVAPFSNIAVLWAVPFAMLFGFIASMVSFVSTALAFPFTTLTYALLFYILEVSVWFGSIPFASAALPY